MADKLDEILKHVADQADAQVDYTAMHASVLKKAHAKKLAIRKNVIRYGSLAAAAVLLVTVGLSALGGGFIGMKTRSGEPEAFFAAEQPQDSSADVEKSAGEEMITGVAPNPESGSAAGYGEDTDAGWNDSVTPPPGCGITGCATLYWAEQELELPAVAFGENTSVESDEEHFLVTVFGATRADFDDYVARIAEMYPNDTITDSNSTDKSVRGGIFTTFAIMSGRYTLTVTMVEEDVTITVY